MKLRDLDPARITHAATRTLGHAQGWLDAPAEGDAEALRLVLVASEARAALERGEGLTTGQLAALGSVTDGRVRQLVASGELPTDGAAYAARIPADVCREWLAARGVEGVEKQLGASC